MRPSSAILPLLPLLPLLATLAALAGTSAVAGCAAPTDTSSDGDTSTTADELKSRAPLPFVLQFVGTYEDASASAGSVRKLTLTRTGRYTAWIAGQSRIEHGVFFGQSHYTADPSINTIKMVTAGLAWTATIEGYTSKLLVTRSGNATHLTATTTVGPNESLCDASGGAWADDDADPTTGLYCACPVNLTPPEAYIPSAGGCVH